MNRKLALGLLLFINTLWGSSYVVTKVALKELPPPLLVLIFQKYIIAGLVGGAVKQ